MSDEKAEQLNTEDQDQDVNAAQEDQQAQTEDQEFEIAIGGSPSQDRKKGNPMVARIIGQRDKAREESAEKDQRLKQMEAELAALRGNQGGKPKQAPQWADFDSDEAYQKAVVDWAKSQNQPVSQPTNTAQILHRLKEDEHRNQKIDQHYQRAQELAEKFPDYSQAEKAALDVLGDDLVNDIATRAKNSAALMLHFGRNPDAARQFKDLASTDPVEAALELGRLDASVKVQARSKTPPPEPDETLDGGKSSSAGSWQRRLDKLRDNGDIKGAIALKREAKAEGINLE